MAYCDRNFSVHCKNCSFWSNKCERKPIIYVAHPYGGLKANEEDTSEYVSEFIQQYPQFIFFSPVHNYSFYYTQTDYETGLNLCLEFLKYADELWVTGNYEKSRGCLAEIRFATEHDIPIKFFKEGAIGDDEI